MRQQTNKTALMYATDLLARQEQSSGKLREKLRRKGYAEDETELALSCLEERHYLNDAEACARQFDFFYRESKHSVRQICVKLMQRGFESSLVRSCVPQDTYARELQVALRCLRIKFKDSAEERKMMANLYAKGFDSSVVQEAVQNFLEEKEI